MPAAFEYPIKPEGVDELVESERKQRQGEIQKLWKYYKGDHVKPLKVKYGQSDDNIIINVSKILIDRGISMLFGRGVEFQLDGDESNRSESEQYLDLAWRGGKQQTNSQQLLKLNDIALNGYVTGNPTVRIQEGEVPRIINLDPAIVSVFWRMDDLDDILWYSLYWTDNTRQDIVKVMQETTGDIQWLIRDLIRKDERNKSGNWQLQNEEIWEHSWSPIYTWKNLPNPNEFYGISDIEHAELNDRINLVASNTNRILKVHAHPKTIVLGADTPDIVTDEIGGLFTINKPANEVKVFNLEMQSDLASSMKHLNDLRTTFFDLGANVDMTTIKDKLGQLTNFGLRVLFKDALDRLILKRALYGEGLVEINRRLLDLGGFGDDLETILHWPNALPMNEKEEVEIGERKRDLGIISKETLARELGIDWESESELLAAEGTSGDIGTMILGQLQANRPFNRGV